MLPDRYLPDFNLTREAGLLARHGLGLEQSLVVDRRIAPHRD